MTNGNRAERIHEAMAQAQVFASAWSLVGGPFDDGNALVDAEVEKYALQALIADLLAAEHQDALSVCADGDEYKRGYKAGRHAGFEDSHTWDEERRADGGKDSSDSYRLKIANDCCDRLMQACSDAGCPDGVRMDDWIRENVRADGSKDSSVAEKMVRYCPGCGSIGPVEAKYRDCCPDGSDAHMVPEKFAEQCRDTFRLAVSAITQETKMVAVCCGRSECGGECGREWQGMEPVRTDPQDDGGKGEAVAEIIRYETFTGRTAWDIKIRDKSLKNGDLLYRAPQAECAPRAELLEVLESEKDYVDAFAGDKIDGHIAKGLSERIQKEITTLVRDKEKP